MPCRPSALASCQGKGGNQLVPNVGRPILAGPVASGDLVREIVSHLAQSAVLAHVAGEEGGGCLLPELVQAVAGLFDLARCHFHLPASSAPGSPSRWRETLPQRQ